MDFDWLWQLGFLAALIGPGLVRAGVSGLSVSGGMQNKILLVDLDSTLPDPSVPTGFDWGDPEWNACGGPPPHGLHDSIYSSAFG